MEPTQKPFSPPIFRNAPFTTGPAVREPQKTIEINRRGPAPASMVAGGAFYTMYVDSGGDTYLQGGSVTGGNGGTATIADYKLIDDSTGTEEVAGTILYMRAACTATLSDGVLLPGCLLTGASTSLLTGIAIPDNHTFTVLDETGYVYVEIGRWTDDNFLPSAPGNILASGCIGNFHLSRI